MWQQLVAQQSTLWLNIHGQSSRIYHFSLTDSRRGLIVPGEQVRLEEAEYDHLQEVLAELTGRPGDRARPEAFARLGQLLFRLVLPQSIQVLLSRHAGHLVFATEELSLPWELLHDRQGFLALKQPFARVPASYDFVEALFGTGDEPAPQSGRALIVADPADNLRAARAEAADLQALFARHQVPCDVLVGSRQCNFSEILDKIGSGGYDIIHFAGHVQYQAESENSAIVLANNRLLPAQSICKVLRGNPLVFLNACHAAVHASGGPPEPLRSGAQNVRTLAQAFATGNRQGRARVVLGSMWWIDDDVARGMAVRFYDEIFSGACLGDALCRARVHISSTQQDPALWSCYVLFGDPLLAIRWAPAGPAPPAGGSTATAQTAPAGGGPGSGGAGRPGPAVAAKVGEGFLGLGQGLNRFAEFSEGLPWGDDARVALLGAAATMYAMRWPVFSTVHLLLGHTYIENGLINAALSEKGIDPEKARRTLRKMLERSKGGRNTMGFDIRPNLRHILKRAKDFAAKEGAEEVGERHLLLAALGLQDSGAVALLEAFDIDLAALRRRLGGEAPDAAGPAGAEARNEGEGARTGDTAVGAKFGRVIRGEAGPGESAAPGSAAETITPLCLDENVQFTAYRPRVIRPGEWYTMLAFAHLDHEMDRVREQAEQVLGKEPAEFDGRTQDSMESVPRGARLTFVLEFPGARDVEVNPPRRSFLWLEPVHREEFRVRAGAGLDGRVARGRLTVFLGHIVLAEVALSIRVDGGHQPPPGGSADASRASPYRKIFASYSHRDRAVVEQLEGYARALGDRYLRDWMELRAGEVWDDRLMQMIEEADVFQLFWSYNSMRSEFVEHEWRHALGLNRPNFVRPTYWEEPLPELRTPEKTLPPGELRRLHFQLLPANPARPNRGGDVFLPDGRLNQELFEPDCLAALDAAVGQTVATGWATVRSLHLFLGTLNRGGSTLARRVRETYSLSPEEITKAYAGVGGDEPGAVAKQLTLRHDSFSSNARRVLREARRLALSSGRDRVGEPDLLRALLDEKGGIVGKILRKLRVDPSSLLS